MKKTDVSDAVIRVLNDANIAYSVHQGSKHPAVLLVHGGKSVKVWLPASPSDVRSVKSARAFTRRLLRKLSLS
jgi:hypothetical protein